MITETSLKFGVSPTLISKITWCESGHKPWAVHDGGRGKGITGFHKATFNAWLVTYKKEQNETLNYDSTYDQLKLMAWAFSKGDSYRRHWTTYRAYKNGGVYQFTSKVGITYVVKCK